MPSSTAFRPTRTNWAEPNATGRTVARSAVAVFNRSIRSVEHGDGLLTPRLWGGRRRARDPRRSVRIGRDEPAPVIRKSNVDGLSRCRGPMIEARGSTHANQRYPTFRPAWPALILLLFYPRNHRVRVDDGSRRWRTVLAILGGGMSRWRSTTLVPRPKRRWRWPAGRSSDPRILQASGGR
jgi:hypothetical protein